MTTLGDVQKWNVFPTSQQRFCANAQIVILVTRCLVMTVHKVQTPESNVLRETQAGPSQECKTRYILCLRLFSCNEHHGIIENNKKDIFSLTR